MFSFSHFEGLTMNRLSRVGALAALTAVSAVALSQTAAVTVAASEADAAKAIEARQNLFKDIKKLNDPMGAMQRPGGPAVDPALVAKNAAEIAALAAKIPAAYAVDTRQFKSIKTGAMDGIWNSQADFKAKADNLVKVATDAANAGKTGDPAATRVAMAQIGRACGACHDPYRAKP